MGLEMLSQKNLTENTLLKIPKNERRILKVFLLERLYQIIYASFNQVDKHQTFTSEYYSMDSKIIQRLIRGILETEDYTLEGIAYYTDIPFDLIYDAACGINNRISITPWIKIISLYLKVKPDVMQILVNKLLEIRDQNQVSFSSLLDET